MSFLALAALASCFSPWTGEEAAGSVTISIGGGNANNAGRVAIGWEGTNGVPDPTDSSQLEHLVVLTGGPGPDQSETIPVGGGSARFETVAEGNWTVQVSGWLPAEDSSSGVAELKSAGQSPLTVANGSGQASVTMYHAREPVTVTFFDSKYGTIVNTQCIYPGFKAVKPAAPIRAGYIFVGWYEAETNLPFEFDTGIEWDPMPYAKWAITNPTAAGLYQSLDPTANTWLEISEVEVDTDFITSAVDYVNAYIPDNPETEFLMLVGGNAGLSIPPQPSLRVAGTNLIIRTAGTGTPIPLVIELSDPGSMFTVQSGAELTLDSGITLTGPAGNNDNALVIVTEENSTLIMKAGSKISGNTNTSLAGFGGGVHVENYGIFTMEGGEISGNKASRGGGVYVDALGTFTMENGSISNNNAGNLGGGVYVIGGSFTKTGPGEMTGNTADAQGDTVYEAMDNRWRNMDAADGDVIDTTKSDPAESGLPSD